MSEFEYDDEPSFEAEYEQQPTPQDQLTQAYYNDPIGTIGLVANAAAENRAQELAAGISSQLDGIASEHAGNISAQSSTMALNRMSQIYGDEFEQAKPAIVDYIQQRPYLHGADLENPHVCFDVVHSAFEVVKNEVRRERDKNHWEAIKNASPTAYSDGV